MSVRALLDALRWDVDQCVVNPFGERVWLKACHDASGRRIGITDCCLASEPCERHRMTTELRGES